MISSSDWIRKIRTMVEQIATFTRSTDEFLGQSFSVFDEPSDLEFIGYMSDASTIAFVRHDNVNYEGIVSSPDDTPIVGVVNKTIFGSLEIESSSTIPPNKWERLLNTETSVQMGVVNQLDVAQRGTMLLRSVKLSASALSQSIEAATQFDDLLADTLLNLHGTISGQWAKLTRETVRSQDLVSDNRFKASLVVELSSSFENESVEDGMDHPAEKIIAEALQVSQNRRVLAWLLEMSTDVSQPSFAASVMNCLARQVAPGSTEWRANVVRSGLRVNDVEIRDAAVQAIEEWADSGLVEILKLHEEEEPWLRNYIFDVIEDLT